MKKPTAADLAKEKTDRRRFSEIVDFAYDTQTVRQYFLFEFHDLPY
ncbi:MAG: hypothetical protein ACYSW6_07985 [Planctomycetota bacterium]|jgi:hypothetical protein